MTAQTRAECIAAAGEAYGAMLTDPVISAQLREVERRRATQTAGPTSTGAVSPKAADMRRRRAEIDLPALAAEIGGRQGQETGFWERVDKTGDCWIYAGPFDRDGYGKFSYRGQYFAAHRFSYLALVGSLTADLQIDHTCRVRACVNPAHLDQVTAAENCMRKPRATHCSEGHELVGDNAMPDNHGSRRCRICRNAKRRAARRNTRKTA